MVARQTVLELNHVFINRGKSYNVTMRGITKIFRNE